jgi:hypothetical protein
MKKWLTLIVFIGCSYTSHSQVLIGLLFGDKLNSDKIAFGLMGGPGFADISHIESKPRTVFNLGLYFSIRLGEKWILEPEAWAKLAMGAKEIPPYSTGDAGLDSFFRGGSITREIKGFSGLVTIRYPIWKTLYFELGPQANLTTKVKDIFTNTVHDNKLDYIKDVEDAYTALDFGMIGGLVYRFSPNLHGMSLGTRYYLGLTDIMKNTASTQSNRMFQVNLYIPIGAAKAAEREAQKKQSKTKN